MAGSLHADAAAEKATIFLLTRTHPGTQDLALHPSTHLPSGMWVGCSVAEQPSRGNKEQSHRKGGPMENQKELESLAASKCLVPMREYNCLQAPGTRVCYQRLS